MLNVWWTYRLGPARSSKEEALRGKNATISTVRTRLQARTRAVHCQLWENQKTMEIGKMGEEDGESDIVDK